MLAADAYGFLMVTNWQCMTCSHRTRLRSEQQMEANIKLILAVVPGPNKLIPPQRCPPVHARSVRRASGYVLIP